MIGGAWCVLAHLLLLQRPSELDSLQKLRAGRDLFAQCRSSFSSVASGLKMDRPC
jgi:hypothetical protein